MDYKRNRLANKQYLRYLTTSYKIQSLVGIFITLFGSFIVAVMSIDSPSAVVGSAFLGGVFAFLILSFLTIFVPLLAMEELEHHPKKSRLFFNLLNIVLLLFIFWPLAIWDIYALYRLFFKR